LREPHSLRKRPKFTSFKMFGKCALSVHLFLVDTYFACV